MSVRPPAIVRESIDPVVTRKTDANVSVASTGSTSTWGDVDAGGNASARPMDIVIPACRVGEWVTVTPSLLFANGSAATVFDIWAVVSGVAAHQFASGIGGHAGWFVAANAVASLGASSSYLVQSGDLENVVDGVGSLRLRLRYIKGSGTAGTITCSGGYEWRLEGWKRPRR